jgi:hypothetical protein
VQEAVMGFATTVGWLALGCLLTGWLLGWLLEGVAPRPVRLLVALRERRRKACAVLDATPVLLELELKRIAERIQAEYAGCQPAKAERLRGWVIAYDSVLLDLCEVSDIPPPRRGLPLSAEQRFDLEYALVGCGHSW